MKHSYTPRLLILIALLMTLTGSALAQSSFTENFSTSSSNDASVTTADWNTTAGELKLFPFASSLVSSRVLSGSAMRITVDGDYAYLGGATTGLHIVDIANSSLPGSAINFATGGTAIGIEIAGDRAYVANGASGLLVVDITDPTVPSTLGSYNTSGYAWDVAVSGDRAYVADSASGLQVFDVSGATPALVGSYNTAGSSYGVAVHGDHVYIADHSNGLLVFDVSNPALPLQVGQYNTPGSAYNVALAGNIAYVADLGGGLQVIDISDPTAPTLLGNFATTGAETVDISGDRAYIACGNGGLKVVDISNPALPTLVEIIMAGNNLRGVCLAGHHAFVADNAGLLRVVEVAKPSGMEFVTEMYPGFTIQNIATAGNLAVVANRSNGSLGIVDITDPTAPVLSGTYTHSSGIADFVLVENYVYVAAGHGLSVIDISVPSSPTVVGSWSGGNNVTDIVLLGNYAYVSTDTPWVAIISISDPANPWRTSFYTVGGPVAGMSINGDRAYVLENSGVLNVADITVPHTPVTISTLNIPGIAKDIVVDGNFAFLAYRDDGLKIYDVSNPAAITWAGGYNPTGWCTKVSVDGEFAFLAAGSSGNLMLNVSNVSSPTLQGFYEPLNDGAAMAVSGNYAYAGGLNGLQVMQAYQYEVDTDNNLAQTTSRPIYDNAIAVRVIPTETGTVNWEISPDHGSTWLPSVDSNWAHFDDTAGFLRWRAILAYSADAPTIVDAVQIEWLHEYAEITDVADIPGDQGGQVRLEWLRSGRDFIGDSQQITEYAVYRQVDSAAKSSAVPVGSAVQDLTMQSLPVQEHAALVAASGWDFVTTVPVRVQDDYGVVVPTLADSSVTGGQHLTTYMVSAMTAMPGVFFDSAPDSGYSVDNLAPNVPLALTAAYQPDQVQLDWDDAPEADFRYFRVYRGTDPGFVPGPGNLVTEVTASVWTDPTADAWDYFYKVSAVDFAGNESAAGEIAIASDVPNTQHLHPFALNDASPNPFNPSTMLSFTLPGDAKVRLAIYDLAGRHIRTLVQGSLVAGGHEVFWDGKNNGGTTASSGIYLYRIEAGNFNDTKRMTLLK